MMEALCFSETLVPIYYKSTRYRNIGRVAQQIFQWQCLNEFQETKYTKNCAINNSKLLLGVMPCRLVRLYQCFRVKKWAIDSSRHFYQTKCVQQTPWITAFLRSWQFLSYSGNFKCVLKPKSSLPCSQQPVSFPYPKPNKLNPRLPISFPENPF